MRALLLLYYFPPSGGPGVQRGVKLCRYLPEHGIEPVVVTLSEAGYRAPGEYPPDPTLEADLPAGLRVVRTPPGGGRTVARALARLRLHRAAQHLAPAAFFERQAGWFAPALSAVLREVRRQRPDVLLTSSQPYTAHLVGREVRRLTGLPWVADFRDPWTLSWGRSWPSLRAFRFEERSEEQVLATADRVVVNTPGSRRELLERRPWLDPLRVDVVRNGYDPEDFDVAPAYRPEGEVLVVHSGSFRARPEERPRTGLRSRLDRAGPEPVPYDLSTHSPEPLLRALAEAGAGVRARLVGPLHLSWLRRARELGVADRVEVLGYRPHREATAHLLAADLLYLPTITRRDGAPVTNVPAKTYEYLGSGAPVAALAGPGDVRDLVGGRPRVRLLGPADAPGLASLLGEIRGGGGPRREPPDPEDAHPYRRQAVAAGVAAALAAAAGKGERARVCGDSGR